MKLAREWCCRLSLFKGWLKPRAESSGKRMSPAEKHLGAVVTSHPEPHFYTARDAMGFFSPSNSAEPVQLDSSTTAASLGQYQSADRKSAVCGLCRHDERARASLVLDVCPVASTYRIVYCLGAYYSMQRTLALIICQVSTQTSLGRIAFDILRLA